MSSGESPSAIASVQMLESISHFATGSSILHMAFLAASTITRMVHSGSSSARPA